MDYLEVAAEIAHETNRLWCEANGDFSQPRWEFAPDWQKESARDGVRFHCENPDAGDAASHENWMKHKLEDGWVFGPSKDPALKTHPCLVPFEALPREQQVKDALFRSIVHAITKDLEL